MSQRPSARHAAPGRDLLQALDRSQQALAQHLHAQALAAGAGPDLISHLSAMRLYQRVPYLLTEWVPDPERRDRVITGLGSHIIAMKLLDDVVDGDSGLDHKDLLLHYMLLQDAALVNLCQVADDPLAVLRAVQSDFEVICFGQVRTKRHLAEGLPTWRQHADTYGARFLACYAGLASLCGGVPETVPFARAFGAAFGMVITIADDLRDYSRHGEREGNLAHLLRCGTVGADDVVALLEELRTQALSAVSARPTHHDLAPLVHQYVDDVLVRALPEHVR